MTLEQARALRAALDTAIGQAEAAGRDQVELQAALDARLGAAIDELQAAVEERRPDLGAP